MSREVEEMLKDPKMGKLVNAGIKAVENQTKLVDAALIAATAFARLVEVISKAVEKMER
jgi:hypothetical protein